MRLIVSNQITVQDETVEFYKVLSTELTVMNPDYVKKYTMGLPIWDTPKTICMFTLRGKDILVPYGCLYKILEMCPDAEVINELPKNVPSIDYRAKVPLYDYQQAAVDAMAEKFCGILQAPAGSGKTQMGIALAARLGVKTLWLTHTIDLAQQSYERAALYMPESMLGTILGGKVHIGTAITFATVQKMANLDLNLLKNEWDCIIVDECHRVAGTPLKMTRFSKVLNALAAHYKFGLSATVHRSDGLIAATFCLLGKVAYAVPDKEVSDRVMKVSVAPIALDTEESDVYRSTDGKLVWAKYLQYLGEHQQRNEWIIQRIIANKGHSCLILSERLSILRTLMSMLPDDMKSKAVMIDGSMVSKEQKNARRKAIQSMQSGRMKYLFASYGLAKEGLDIPRLDRLFLVTPKTDYAVVIQSIGRIARTFEGKEEPIVYDFVDTTRYGLDLYRKRCRHYRKNKVEFIDVEGDN